ncbi:MAG: glycosyltransferase family 92 protein [Paracoccaceae bacterium]|nr:glycosyltransferase family 92 protein [Paracoccaceae bacterium]
MFGFLKRAQSITRIAFDPPTAIDGRAGLALVLIVRNEQRHIAEWARFHALAGVAHFYIYDNGCTDATVAALRGAVAMDALTVTPWDQKLRGGRRGHEIHNQVLAYAHATRNFGGHYRWMSYLDVDEFLVPKQAADLPGALAHLGACRNVSLPWHMFGRAGHMRPPEGGVLENYTRRNPDPISAAKGLRNFKMIVDPCHVTAIKVHSIETDGQTRTCNDAGVAFSMAARETRAFYSAAHIQLNHYYTRSDAELRAKIARGPNLTTPDADHLRRVMRKVDHIEAGEVEDLSALAFLARKGIGAWP